MEERFGFNNGKANEISGSIHIWNRHTGTAGSTPSVSVSLFKKTQSLTRRVFDTIANLQCVRKLFNCEM